MSADKLNRFLESTPTSTPCYNSVTILCVPITLYNSNEMAKHYKFPSLSLHFPRHFVPPIRRALVPTQTIYKTYFKHDRMTTLRSVTEKTGIEIKQTAPCVTPFSWKSDDHLYELSIVEDLLYSSKPNLGFDFIVENHYSFSEMAEFGEKVTALQMRFAEFRRSRSLVKSVDKRWPPIDQALQSSIASSR